MIGILAISYGQPTRESIAKRYPARLIRKVGMFPLFRHHLPYDIMAFVSELQGRSGIFRGGVMAIPGKSLHFSVKVEARNSDTHRMSACWDTYASEAGLAHTRFCIYHWISAFYFLSPAQVPLFLPLTLPCQTQHLDYQRITVFHTRTNSTSEKENW